MTWLKAILNLATGILRYLSGRQEAANDPALKQAKKAQQNQTEIDKGNQDIAKAAAGDKKALDQIRKDVS